jgi:hypothetical protein
VAPRGHETVTGETVEDAKRPRPLYFQTAPAVAWTKIATATYQCSLGHRAPRPAETLALSAFLFPSSGWRTRANNSSDCAPLPLVMGWAEVASA